MRAYDNYNPRITYNNEEADSKPAETDNVSADEESGADSSKRKAASKRKRTAPSKPKAPQTTGKPKLLTRQFYRDLAANNTLRLLLGVALACFGVYLTIAFISYLKACVVDQSAISNATVGTLKDVANTGGEAGARLSELLINNSFGLGSIVILFWVFAMCLKFFGTGLRFKTVNFTIKCLVALIAVSLIVGLLTISLESPVNWGGVHGRYVNEFIIDFFGYAGASILCLFVLAVFVIICLSDFILWINTIRKRRAARRKALAEQRRAEEERIRMIREMENKEHEDAVAAGEATKAETTDEEGQTSVSFENQQKDADTLPASELDTYNLEDEEENDEASSANDDEKDESTDEEEPASDGITSPMVVNRGVITEGEGKAPKGNDSTVRRSPYKFPPYNLLSDNSVQVEIDPQEQLENKEKIRKTLADFGIPIVSIEATVGPTVTLYEIVPEKGVKISKIRGLVDDIALRIAAIGVRIIAPIPGKGTVGIEVANKDPQTVSMRSIIKSQAFQQSRYRLPIAFGATISNKVYITDLAKMPHLLVAGATGQGKSVGLNVLINSLLYSKRPDELKFVLIDPKMVEFSLYAALENSYLAKMPDEEDAIITDVTRVAPTLSSLCVEMDQRYMLLKQAGSRDIEEYNKRFNDHELNPENGHKFLPYIVIIVDEFSDLIMQSGKEVEIPVARLAQKARAVGIHVIIATQRPSTDVITGVIKGNFPSRIAFKVSSGVDSKTILDTTGAQQLIGRGDMLVSNNSEMTRVQCAFIATDEVKEICSYIAKQPYQQGPYILPEPRVEGEESSSKDNSSLNDRDPLFEEIARRIVSSNSTTASTSSLQRLYSIGYNRAGKIMDQLERAGVVGPAHGGKPRNILIDAATLEEILSN